MDVLEMTRELVAIDSQNPGPQEPAIADVVTAWCQDAGFSVQRLEPHPGRPNLLVTIDAGGAGRHLALSGHLDTKPVGDALAEWRTDPLTLTVDGDLAFGLGSTDMKGAVAAMIAAARSFASTATAGTLSLLLTADEEQGSNAGAKALLELGLPPFDAIVIGEPSGIEQPWEALFLVSRGIACFHVTVTTHQGHSGLSDRLGPNAVQLAGRLLDALDDFSPAVRDPGPIAAAPTVNPGIKVQGGVGFGTWPGEAVLSSEVRLVPGMRPADLDAELRALITRVLDGQAGWDLTYEAGSQAWMPPAGLDPRHPVVASAQAACREALGAELPLRAYPGSTDAAYLMGQGGLPTITSLGPGWLSVAHGANECVGVRQLSQAARLYATLALQFTGEGDPDGR